MKVSFCTLSFLCFSLCRTFSLSRAFAQDNLKHASELIQRGEYALAEATLQTEVRADPGSVAALRLLGIVYQHESKLKQAEKVLEKAAQQSQHKDPETLFVLCQVKFALKKSSEGLALANRLSAVSENDPRTQYSIGRLLLENSYPEQATQELEKARALAPGSPAVQTELIIACLAAKHQQKAESLIQLLLKDATYEDLIQAGSRFGEMGQFAAAAHAFERALQLLPGSYDAQFNLAFADYRQGDFWKALDALNQVSSQAAAEQPDYHYLRGKVELALHQDQAAGKELLKGLAQQPDNESLCSDTGLLFFHAENFWKALEVYETCARRLSDSVPIETGLGLTYFRLGKYDDAIHTFKKVLALRVDADPAREALAFLFYISGNLAEARTLLEERLGARDIDYYAYYLHALVLLRLEARGQHADVLRSLAEALRRNPKFAPAYFQRGKIRAEQGDAARALFELQKATELDPDYAQPYYLIAQIEYKLGKKNEADQARQRFAALDREKEEKDQKQQVENRLLQSFGSCPSCSYP